jgi:hypothetical protein
MVESIVQRGGPVHQAVYICGIGEDGLTNGWVYGVMEKNSDWLGSPTGPHTKEVWMEKYARLCSKVLISHGYK